MGRIFRCWGLVGLGNLIGSLIVAYLVAVSLTGNFSLELNAVAKKFIAVSTARSLGLKTWVWTDGSPVSFGASSVT
ncbi:nitrite transporter from formate/nitrite family [Vibrio variabilis]|uniref:Nitrite transporter from formate/nitrite family n=1 Tax=Vibrio variabilis TaxID=990271 RepID=A0ABQ0JK77_9VIBR|nr:nitrite transporter from formate/nitrite family [Vibrio variabilis]